MEGKIGNVGKYELNQGQGADAGKLVVEVDASLGNSSAGIVVKLSEKDVLDYFANKFGPSSLIGEALKAAEAAIPSA